jgi:hypothetical protein
VAITYRGSVSSQVIFGNGGLIHNLFAIENGIGSRVNVNIRRLAVQNDALTVYTAVMPLVRVSRVLSVAGGGCIEKPKFDTALTSDPLVKFRAAISSSDSIVATAGTTVWTHFMNRMRTAVEQQQGQDESVLPVLVRDSGKEFVIRPGQYVVVQAISAAVAANAATMNNWMVLCSWEEDSISTFSISGNVTLGGVAISGAKVYVIEADDRSGTNAVLREVVTTVSGAWSSTIKTGKVGAAFVQYETGGALYTAPGSPFLES